MSKRSQLAVLLLVVSSVAANVQAQATRTWVSGVGDDVNPCSRTAPCKTFAGAISKTATGGEISALDPGGYGTITIVKSITINGNGTLASILNAGTNGVNVNCSGCTVTLREIDINGAGTGNNGVNIVQARAVHLTNVRIWGQRGTTPGRGVNISTSTDVDVFMDHCRIWDVGNQAVANLASAGTPNVRVQVEDCVVEDNRGGAGGDAFFFNAGTKAVISRTMMAGFVSAGVEANNAEVTVSDSVINNCTNGVFVTGTGIARLDRNTIINNTTSGFSANSGGQVLSAGDNYWANNGANVGSLGTFLKQ